MHWEVSGEIVSKSRLDKVPEKILKDRTAKKYLIADEVYVRAEKYKNKVDEKMKQK